MTEESLEFGKVGEFDIVGSMYSSFVVQSIPEPNFWLAMGEDELDIKIGFRVKRTWVNRMKWWCFCRVFPFRIEKWETPDA